MLAGAYFITVSVLVLRSKQSPVAAKLALGVLILAIVQLGAGGLNLLLLAPVWMQITHLLLADLVWISLVLLAMEAKLR